MLQQTADGSKEKGCLPEFRGRVCWSIKQTKVPSCSAEDQPYSFIQ